jgi:hypothetical protein
MSPLLAEKTFGRISRPLSKDRRRISRSVRLGTRAVSKPSQQISRAVKSLRIVKSSHWFNKGRTWRSVLPQEHAKL